MTSDWREAKEFPNSVFFLNLWSPERRFLSKKYQQIQSNNYNLLRLKRREFRLTVLFLGFHILFAKRSVLMIHPLKEIHQGIQGSAPFFGVQVQPFDLFIFFIFLIFIPKVASRVAIRTPFHLYCEC